MNWDAIGAIGQVLGSVAVFITLGYVAVQVRHANRNSALAAVQANRAERRAWFLATRDSPYMAKISVKLADGESLDAEENSRYTIHLNCDFSLFYSEWVNRDIGLVGEYAVFDLVYLDIFASSKPHREWWKRNGRRIYPQRFWTYMEMQFEARDRGMGLAQPA